MIAVSYEGCGGVIPADVYSKACIHSLDEALACCNRIGYPAMLKASWGGGGKGIRKVRAQGLGSLPGRCVGPSIEHSVEFSLKNGLRGRAEHLPVCVASWWKVA